MMRETKYLWYEATAEDNEPPVLPHCGRVGRDRGRGMEQAIQSRHLCCRLLFRVSVLHRLLASSASSLHGLQQLAAVVALSSGPPSVPGVHLRHLGKGREVSELF